MRKKTWTSYKHLRYDKHKMVGEHKIIMPELPEDPSEVFFIDEDEDNAFWQRDIVEATYRPIWFNFIPHYTKMWQDATLEDDRGAPLPLGLLAFPSTANANQFHQIFFSCFAPTPYP